MVFMKEHLRRCGHKMKDNPWIIASSILAIIVLVLLFGGMVTGNLISKEEAGQTFLNYIQSAGADLSLLEIINISLDNGLYKISFKYQGEEYPVPFYITSDGRYIGNLNEIKKTEVKSTSSSSTSQEIVKSDKPKVELFIWGYCPYGVQAQGPMAEVASLLNNYAEFSIVPYYSGHGEFEHQQNKIQSCIQELYSDKYWSYAAGFAEKIYPKCGQNKSVQCDLTESTNLMKSLGINSIEVLNCVDSQGEDLFSKASSYAQSNKISGSPTIMINGVKVSIARNADAIKTAVCNAFNNAPPECSEVLNSVATASSGSC